MLDQSVPDRAKEFGWDVSPIEGGYDVDFNDERGVMQLGTEELENWLTEREELKREFETKPWWKFW